MNKKKMILQLIEHYSNGNKAQFANMLGISPQGLSTWIKRDTYDTELIYSKCEGLSASWLLTGEGDMLKTKHTPKDSPSCKQLPDTSKDNTNFRISQEKGEGIPYYDVDFLGGFCEIYNDQSTLPTYNIIVPGFEKATVWCNVTGHSMEPRISHGDIIALRQCSLDDVQYGEIYAVVLDTIRTIKIIRRGSSSNVLRYVPINPDFDEQEFPVSRILHVFEVIGTISKFF